MHRSALWALTGLVLCLIGLGGMSGVALADEPGTGGTFWMPPQSSTFAAEVDAIFYYIYYLSVVFFVGIIGAMVFFTIVYRRREEGQRTSPNHGNTNIEIAWSVIPGILLLSMFFMGFTTWMDMNVPPADAMEVRVTGQKWNWNYEYPETGIFSNELVVPAGKPVKLTINSVDVLHSFYVPDFRIKKDAVPNRYTQLWFEAPEPGEHQVYCTEYCGDLHSRMLSVVKVLPMDKYEAWVKEQTGPVGGEAVAMHVAGEKLFHGKYACNACHSVDGSAGAGIAPTLKGKYGATEQLADGSSAQVDDNYIRESIVDPNAKIVAGFMPAMPTFAGRIDDAEMAQIIEYLKSIGANADQYQPVGGTAAAVEPWQVGEKLFNGKMGCNACHTVDGTPGPGNIAPSLKDKYGSVEKLADGSSVTVDDAYIRESMYQPNAKIVAGFNPAMPTVEGRMNDEEFAAVLAYLKHISGPAEVATDGAQQAPGEGEAQAGDAEGTPDAAPAAGH